MIDFLVDTTLDYNPEGREIVSRWKHWNFSILMTAIWSRVQHSASNRNEYQKLSWGEGGCLEGLTTNQKYANF